MKQLTIREARQALSHLESLLAAEGELMITRRGKAIAWLVPIARDLVVPSHKNLRSKMPRLRKGSEVLVRQDRDGR